MAMFHLLKAERVLIYSQLKSIKLLLALSIFFYPYLHFCSVLNGKTNYDIDYLTKKVECSQITAA